MRNYNVFVGWSEQANRGGVVKDLTVQESEGIITELFVTATNYEQPKMSIKRRIDK